MSYYANEQDIIDQLRAYGLNPDLPLSVDTAKPVRCLTTSGSRERTGWYVLFSITVDGNPCIIGSYGNWSGNDSGKQKTVLSVQSSARLTPEQLQAIKIQQREAQKKAEADRQREADSAATKARLAWEKFPTDGTAEYLTRKQVGAYGIRYSKQGSIIVPMRNDHDAIRGLQFILDKTNPRVAEIGRDKEFWPRGLSIAGTWHMIGEPPKPRDIILMAEGYATGSSLHEATGETVFIVWSANNIMASGQNLRKKYKRNPILICADDDWLQKCSSCGQHTPVKTSDCSHCQQPHGKKNAGIISAEAAAVAIGGAWIVPRFAQERHTDRKSLSDFNDLHVTEGRQTVSRQINDKITALGWSAPSLVAPTYQGGGEARAALKSMLNIEEALERFSMIYGGKGTMFDHHEHLLVPKADVLDILPEHGWRDMRAHKKVARLDEVGFDPAGHDRRITCNLWGGWPTTPKKGDCSQLLALLRHLCSNEADPESVYQWTLQWLAYPIQNPGAKMRTSLVLHGPQGTGKNLFFESVMAIYGEYGRIVDQSAIEDKFNDWASKKLFLIADEVVARTELFHVKNKLKGLVTGEWVRINPKNVAAHDERNHVNIVFLSNEAIPLVLEHDDRRYMIIHTPEKLPAEFYDTIRHELNAGGIAALHQHLLGIDTSGFDIHTKPIATRAKTELIEASLDSVQAFVRDWYRGEITGIPFCPCLSSHLFKTYLKFCDHTMERHPRKRNQFIGDLRMLPGWSVGDAATWEAPHISTNKTRKMVIPPLNLLGDHIQKPNQQRGQWLSESLETFMNAAGWSETP